MKNTDLIRTVISGDTKPRHNEAELYHLVSIQNVSDAY